MATKFATISPATFETLPVAPFAGMWVGNTQHRPTSYSATRTDSDGEPLVLSTEAYVLIEFDEGSTAESELAAVDANIFATTDELKTWINEYQPA
jgi:hypothetical protein